MSDNPNCKLSLQTTKNDSSVLDLLKKHYPYIAKWPFLAAMNWLNWYCANRFCIVGRDQTLSPVAIVLYRPTDRPSLMHEWWRYYTYEKGTVLWIDLICDPGLCNIGDMLALYRAGIGQKEYIAFSRNLVYPTYKLHKESTLYVKFIRRSKSRLANGTTSSADTEQCGTSSC